MTAVSYSFCLSMVHSFWQAAILLCCYFLFNRLFLKNSHPAQRRNFLLVLLSFQLVLSGITFVYAFGQYTHNVDSNGRATLFLNTGIVLEYIAPSIFYLYICTVLYKCTRFIIAWKNLTPSFYKNLQKPLLDYKLFCAEKALQLGIKKPVKLWFSNSITTPFTYGFLKPVILMPIALINQLSCAQAEAIILHELSHIKANDYLLNWWLIVLENIFFFNPFVRRLCNKIRLEREKSCDMQVIHFNYKASAYAEALLQIQKHHAFQFQLAATGSQKHLLNRIRYFTKDYQYMNNSSLQNGLFRLAMCFTIFISLVALVNLNGIIIKEPPTYGVPGIAMQLFTNDNNILAKNSNEFAEPIKNNTALLKNNANNPAVKKEPVKKIKTHTNKPLEENNNANAQLIPVAYDEESLITKQVIIQEQVSGSDKTILKAYNAVKINGKWVLTPDWIITGNFVKDSTGKMIIDSSLNNQQ